MGCSESRVEPPSSHTQSPAPYNRDAPLTLTIEDLRLQTYIVQVRQGTSVQELYAQMGQLRDSQCSLYYQGEWLPPLSTQSLGDFGLARQAKLDLLDIAQ